MSVVIFDAWVTSPRTKAAARIGSGAKVSPSAGSRTAAAAAHNASQPNRPVRPTPQGVTTAAAKKPSAGGGDGEAEQLEARTGVDGLDGVPHLRRSPRRTGTASAPSPSARRSRTASGSSRRGRRRRCGARGGAATRRPVRERYSPARTGARSCTYCRVRGRAVPCPCAERRTRRGDTARRPHARRERPHDGRRRVRQGVVRKRCRRPRWRRACRPSGRGSWPSRAAPRRRRGAAMRRAPPG